MEKLKLYLHESKQDRKGLTFYTRGNVINGYVINIADDYVEVRNQTTSKILIFLDRIDGIGMV